LRVQQGMGEGEGKGVRRERSMILSLIGWFILIQRKGRYSRGGGGREGEGSGRGLYDREEDSNRKREKFSERLLRRGEGVIAKRKGVLAKKACSP